MGSMLTADSAATDSAFTAPTTKLLPAEELMRAEFSEASHTNSWTNLSWRTW